MPRHPPHRSLSVPFSYTHRPGRSGSHGPAGSGVDFPIPQNSICMRFAKNGLASSQKRIRAPRTPRGGQRPANRRPGPRNHPVYQYCYTFVVPRPAAALPAPFSYTHRPGRSGRHGPAGSGVDFPLPQNSSVWVLLKMGSRAPTPGDGSGGRPGPGRAPAGTREALQRRAGRWASPPNPPTLHPKRPTLYRPLLDTLRPAAAALSSKPYPRLPDAECQADQSRGFEPLTFTPTLIAKGLTIRYRLAS